MNFKLESRSHFFASSLTRTHARPNRVHGDFARNWLGLFFLATGLMMGVSYGQDAPAKGNPDDEAKVVLEPGDHDRKLTVGEQKRNYIVHIPTGHDPKKPTPVVLALHGAGMNGSMMRWFCGLNKTSDANGFIAVYPSGTGSGPFLTWNAGGLIGKLNGGRPDDVAFMGSLLDDLGTLVTIDEKRIYACGLSNGGMMCYRLAIEMSDTIVPYGPPYGKTAPMIRLKGVEETVEIWVKLNGCETKPQTETLSKEGDKTPVTRTTYGGGKNGSEVVLVTIEGGGHTWPGQQPPVAFIGKSARNISANELIWEFFQKHPLE